MRAWHTSIVVLLCCGPAAAEVKFPYTGDVTTDNVFVRSGPGKQYYATAKLKKHSQIEVWRHDPGGWLAVRPPQGSFTWVSGRYVKTTDEQGVVEVTGDRVAARVGSSLTSNRDVISVRLNRGERLQVVEIDDGGSQVWYKVAPPAGEFRWVYGKFVRPSEATSNKTAAKPRGFAALRPPRGAVADAAEASADKSSTREPAERMTPADSAPAAANPTEVPDHEAAAVDPNQPVDPTAPRDALQEQLDDIEKELAQVVTGDPSTWRCEPLGKRAEALLANAGSAVQRGRVRLVLNKIRRFESLKKRRLQVGGIVTRTDKTDRQLQAQRPSIDKPESQDRYDGAGILKRIRSNRSDAPRYALTGQRDRVLFFVEPAPDVNLDTYLGRRVGVTGVRGYNARFAGPEITAKRIDVLDEPRRR